VYLEDSGEKIEYGSPKTPEEILRELKRKPYGAPVAARVDGDLVDLSAEITKSCRLSFVTASSGEGRAICWHSASHIMAKAVKELFPAAKLGIGPSIEDGFYYDFDVKQPFSPEDLERVEKRMEEIIRDDLPFRREELTVAESMKLFRNEGESYKVELLKEIEDQSVSLYYLGDFVDLCRGPHVPSSGLIKNFKLLSVAGAYWKGDEKNPMLQRIYGTAYEKREDLELHLKRIEEARRRDHRKLGPELELFNLYDEAGAGLILWLPKGTLMRRTIEEFWVEEHLKRGYQLLATPHIARGQLWQSSGHYQFFRENMYFIDVGDEEYVLKPMNCPYHILVYRSKIRSYRDLPLRYAELGTVYRYERSGTLHGMLRVRGFTQDDAHIFCTPEQLKDEIVGVIDLATYILGTFGFKEYEVDLSVRDPGHPERYMGSDEDWVLAEESLELALQERDFPYQKAEGEAIFYGPKIDMKLLDALGRRWQATTIQFDFNLPGRFGVEYMGADGKRRPALMVHRAIFGSLERFFGVLIEHYGGLFPLWISPLQVKVMNITDSEREYSQSVADQLMKAGFRVETDLRNEKIGLKIRDAEVAKVPYMVVIGKREHAAGNISLRSAREGDLGNSSISDFVKRLSEEVESRS